MEWNGTERNGTEHNGTERKETYWDRTGSLNLKVEIN